MGCSGPGPRCRMAGWGSNKKENLILEDPSYKWGMVLFTCRHLTSLLSEENNFWTNRPLILCIFSTNRCAFGFPQKVLLGSVFCCRALCTSTSSPTRLPCASVIMDGAAAGCRMESSWKMWRKRLDSRQKRTCKHISLWGNLTANCSEECRLREKGQRQRKSEEGEIRF